MYKTGKLVIIKNHTIENFDKILNWNNDEALSRIEGRNHKKSEDEILKEVKSFIENNAEKMNKFIHFAIHKKKNTELIGYSDFINIDYVSSHGELCLSIADRSLWNKGYGIDALLQIIDFIFKDLKIHRIEFNTLAINTSVINICNKLNIYFEGIKRNYLLLENSYIDLYNFSILDNEWKSLNYKFNKLII